MHRIPPPPSPPAPPASRAVRDDDAAALIALVGAAFEEHPGCVLDLAGIDADLAAPATSASASGTAWWVLPGSDGLDATVGCGPVVAGVAELKRLYVAAHARRRGLASALVATVEAYAADVGATQVELWTDTRFTDAHALYGRLGYRPTGEDRDLHDPSATTEWRFVRDLPRG